ncbi:MAG: type II secretion system protein GspD [Phycisphaerales bacterium]
MRYEANRTSATMAAGLTAAALLLAAGQASAQTQSGKTAAGASAAPAASGASGTGSGAKTSGGKTYSNAGAKKATPPATAKPGNSNAPKPLVTGGTSLGDLIAAQGGTPPGATTAAAPEPKRKAPDASTGDEPGDGTESGVKVSDYMTVDIFVQDEDLANVLQMLSLQSRKNIIASKDVSATVSANLYGVTFYEALDSVLHVNGYGYIEKGNFIYVHTLEEIAAIEAAERKTVSKVIRLNYLNANDAAEFVSPLLSENGQIKTNGDPGEFTLSEDAPGGNEQYALSAMLIVYDYADHIAEVEELLKQIDTKPAQVLVEATILQTSLNEANAFGVDFSVLHDVNFLDFLGVGPLGAPGSLGGTGTDNFGPLDNEGSAVSSTAGNFAGPGTIKAAILADQVGVFIRALDEVGNVSILSNPKILALNRQPAKVLVGRKLGYLNTTATETSTTQTVEFLDTGTQLSFRPFVSNDGMVRMELKPRVSEGVIRTATDATGAAVTIPDEITQEITTNVIVPDGSTVVLGGLFKETTTLNRSQVPVLGDIPILGLAFQGHDDETDRSEIIFMIKPTVVHDKILAEQGERSLAYAERVRTGSRLGLLPFSRERQTAQLNLEAERLAGEGKTDEAMWKLRRSIELNPLQPDAIRLKEQVQNSRDLWPAGSVLERVIDGDGPLAAPDKANTPAGMSMKSGFQGPMPTSEESSSMVAQVPSESTSTPISSQTAGTTQGQSSNLFGALAQMIENPETYHAAQPTPSGDSPIGQPVAASSQTQPQIEPLSQPQNLPQNLAQNQPSDYAAGVTIIPVDDSQPQTRRFITKTGAGSNTGTSTATGTDLSTGTQPAIFARGTMPTWFFLPYFRTMAQNAQGLGSAQAATASVESGEDESLQSPSETGDNQNEMFNESPIETTPR